MKKTIALVISIILLIFALTACGGSKQSEEPAEETTTVEETVEETTETEDPVAGNTYVVTSVKDGDNYHEMGPQDHPSKLVFGTDNTVKNVGLNADGEETETEATYTIKGNVVTITWPDMINGGTVDAQYTIDGDTLTDSADFGDGVMVTTVHTKVTE